LGGQQEQLKFLGNHQCSEGKAHLDRYEQLVDQGPQKYHQIACREADLPPEQTALMATAANMDLAARETIRWDQHEIDVIVTAGVQGNATRATDPAKYEEKGGQWVKSAPLPGTINTLILFNHALQHHVLPQGIMMATEAKAAALQDLNVGSLASKRLATGTGTDQIIIACPKANDLESPMQSVGSHTRMGELLAKTVYRATLKALEWQNGLIPSLSRGLQHLFRRLDISEEELFQEFSNQTYCPPDLLIKNKEAVFYDVHVSAIATALISILDRVEHGALPQELAIEHIRRQGALIAVSLSGNDDIYPQILNELSQSSTPGKILAQSIALGWRAKWSS
jgi:adenosylcobinamide amidohydrolase